VLDSVFSHLFAARVVMEGMILKPNMVIPGKKCADQSSPEKIAEATLRTLKRQVPVAVPGIEDLVQAAAGQHQLRPADQATLAAAVQLELARRAELRGDRPGWAADGGLPRANREFLTGTDLDSEVRLLSTVAVHWTTVSLAAERIERGRLAAHH